MSVRPSGGARSLEIILGIIAITIGLIVLIFPTTTIVSITVLLAVALLFVGLFRFFWGFAARDISAGARLSAVLVGIIVIVVAIAIIAFPAFAAGTAVILIDIGILIYALGRIATGITSNNESAALRGGQIAIGVLLLILGSIILFTPTLGIALIGLLLGLAFLFIGIESLAAGIIGRRYTPKVPNSEILEP